MRFDLEDFDSTVRTLDIIHFGDKWWNILQTSRVSFTATCHLNRLGKVGLGDIFDQKLSAFFFRWKTSFVFDDTFEKFLTFISSWKWPYLKVSELICSPLTNQLTGSSSVRSRHSNTAISPLKEKNENLNRFFLLTKISLLIADSCSEFASFVKFGFNGS